MIRATTGVWVNYATTFAFQVMFASRMGTAAPASTFAIAYALAIAVATIALSTAQNLALPRLKTAEGANASAAVKLLVALGTGGVIVSAAAFIATDSLGRMLAAHTGLGSASVVDTLRWAALFAGAQVVATQLSTLLLAHGSRFFVAAAPAFPSLVGFGVLVLIGRPTVPDVFRGLTAGTVVEVAGLALLSVGRHRVARSGPIDQGPALLALTVLQFSALAVMLPLETALAGWHASAGSAAYGYAIRSLLVAQQLIVGGVVMASVSTWSDVARSARRHEILPSVARRLGFVCLVSACATGIALAEGRELVAAIYQHGSFTSKSTREVVHVLYAALPGFVAESCSMIISQALVAQRRNHATLTFGFSRVALRVGFAIPFALLWGAVGVASAYSVASLVVLSVQVGFIFRGFVAERLSSAVPYLVPATLAMSLGAMSRFDPSVLPATVAAACSIIVVCGAVWAHRLMAKHPQS